MERSATGHPVMAPMTVLVTGATGYIGSHVCLSLLEQGHEVIGVDNFCNSSRVSLERVTALAGQQVKLYECDVRNGNALMGIFRDNGVDAVVHLAGLKSVAESAAKPLEYYENNLGGTLTLLRVMKLQGCNRLVFSSSAVVYGEQPRMPVTESMRLQTASSVYGHTKAACEQLIADAVAGDAELSAVLLRYFNPVGAHPSGMIGEDARGLLPPNLMPFLVGVAAGRMEKLTVNGNDYPTPDGTCLRDYIHVCDLADGHAAALLATSANAEPHARLRTYNLGHGTPVSVLELLHAFEQATGIEIPYQVGPRRPGDLVSCWADISLAKQELEFAPVHTLEEMCLDAWLFEQQNPGGYQGGVVS